MKNSKVIFTAAAALLGLAACQSAPQTLPPGQYSNTQSTTDANGTTRTTTTDTNVYYDENGNKRAVQETEKSTDPRGLLNKRTSTTTTQY